MTNNMPNVRENEAVVFIPPAVSAAAALLIEWLREEVNAGSVNIKHEQSDNPSGGNEYEVSNRG